MPKHQSEPTEKVWKRPREPKNAWKYFATPHAKRVYDTVLANKGISLIERNVLVDELSTVGITAQFVSRGWVNVCVGWLPSHPELVKEFFANITSCNAEDQSLMSVVRGKEIVFSVATVGDKLKLPVINNPQWPPPPSLVPPRCEIVRELTGGVFSEIDKLRLGFMTPQYRLLLKIICSFIEPCTHTSDATPDQAILMYGLGRGYSYDLATKIWNDVYGYHLHPPGTSSIPFASLLTRFILDHHVYVTPGEPYVLLPPPIGKLTLENSDKPITIPKGNAAIEDLVLRVSIIEDVLQIKTKCAGCVSSYVTDAMEHLSASSLDFQNLLKKISSVGNYNVPGNGVGTNLGNTSGVVADGDTLMTDD
ncbi:hypothetical protein Vadar_033260 [Vaccinium darrowii]|uniref:Uncharacterized protein n=1 Tax=Vaccinium darrowii TaxID=229202 RepID=A0ACB7YSL1_9ERIC|nr:hypothetical protein Vadar_033260 [Vaccinium darrowii]